MVEMEILLESLARIYEKVPGFECIKGCSDCCGPVEWPPIEGYNIMLYLRKNDIEPRTETIKGISVLCPYWEGKCIIYPVRSLICRLYGVADQYFLKCPHINPERELTEKEVKELYHEVKMLDITFRRVARVRRSDLARPPR